MRRFLADASETEALVDFGHSPVFEDADAFPVITVLRKASGASAQAGASVRLARVPRESLGAAGLAQLVADEALAVPTEQFGAGPWSLEPPAVQALLDRLRSGLGRDYSSSLGALVRSTGDAYRIGLPGFESGLSAPIREMASSSSLVQSSALSDAARIGQNTRLWHDSVANSILRLTTGASVFADVPSFASQVRSLSSAPSALATAVRMAGVGSAAAFAAAMEGELPAVSRYVTVTRSEAGSAGGHDASAPVAFATTWVQATAARLGILFSPEVFLALVLNVVTLFVAIQVVFGRRRADHRRRSSHSPRHRGSDGDAPRQHFIRDRRDTRRRIRHPAPRGPRRIIG